MRKLGMRSGATWLVGAHLESRQRGWRARSRAATVLRAVVIVFFGHRDNLTPTVLGLLDAWDGMYRFFCVLSWEIAVVAAPILFGVALLTEAKWGTRARHNWESADHTESHDGQFAR